MADKNMEAEIYVQFTEAASRQSLDSGESITTLWGKVKKWLSDLKSVAFSGSYNDLSDVPTSLPANGGNADTVNNYTVNANVPSDAVFTDTTYDNATTTKSGLMSATDKSKLDDIDIMTGATSSASGTSGLVPAPASGKQSSYLRGDGTWAVPTNTDTKVTNTLSTTTKAYITGTTSSSTNTGTQVFDTGVYLDTTAGTLTATTFKGALSGNATTSNKLASTSYTTITINLSDWTTNSNGGYMCTKTLDNAMPYENFNFDVVLSTDQAAAKLQIEAWNCVIADGNITQTTSNSSTTAFTFYAFTTKPSVALTIAVQGVS